MWGYVLMGCTGVFLSKCYRIFFSVLPFLLPLFFHLLIHVYNVVLIVIFFLSRDCGSVKGTCEDEASIIYAWARNAPPTKLPRGIVSYRLTLTKNYIYSLTEK